MIGVWLSPVSGKRPAGAGMLETIVFLTVIGPFIPIMDSHWSNPINFLNRASYLEGLQRAYLDIYTFFALYYVISLALEIYFKLLDP